MKYAGGRREETGYKEIVARNAEEGKGSCEEDDGAEMMMEGRLEGQ